MPFSNFCLPSLLLGFLGVLTIAVSTARGYTYDPNDFAVEVVSSVGLGSTTDVDDPAAVLGRPVLKFDASANPFVTVLQRTKLVQAPFNVNPNGDNVLATLSLNTAITVRMGRRVEDDPANPFGVDFIVFGNAFFQHTTFETVSDLTDLNTLLLNNPATAFLDDKVKVSVSPDNVNWYRFDHGPLGDQLFPTNAYAWDADAATWTDHELDPTRPVDPSLTLSDFNGLTAADALGLYDGSAGGTGFDLAESGFAWIQYVRFEGLAGFDVGEIDAVADVKPIPEPATVGLLIVGGMALLRQRSR